MLFLLSLCRLWARCCTSAICTWHGAVRGQRRCAARARSSASSGAATCLAPRTICCRCASSFIIIACALGAATCAYCLGTSALSFTDRGHLLIQTACWRGRSPPNCDSGTWWAAEMSASAHVSKRRALRRGWRARPRLLQEHTPSGSCGLGTAQAIRAGRVQGRFQSSAFPGQCVTDFCLALASLRHVVRGMARISDV